MIGAVGIGHPAGKHGGLIPLLLVIARSLGLIFRRGMPGHGLRKGVRIPVIAVHIIYRGVRLFGLVGAEQGHAQGFVVDGEPVALPRGLHQLRFPKGRPHLVPGLVEQRPQIRHPMDHIANVNGFAGAGIQGAFPMGHQPFHIAFIIQLAILMDGHRPHRLPGFKGTREPQVLGDVQHPVPGIQPLQEPALV